MRMKNTLVNGAMRNSISHASILMLLFFTSSISSAQTSQKPDRAGESILGSGTSSANERSPVPRAVGLVAIPDVEAYNQNGKPLRFYTDLIKGKNVVVNFIFTSCTYICPLQGANFSRIQAVLGDRLGKDVSLVSLSIDPVTDTSQRLKAWSEKFGARSGWTLVTGKKAEMDSLLRAFTGDPSGLSEHSAIAFIGNYDRGVWIRSDALDDPTRLIKRLDDALSQKRDR